MISGSFGLFHAPLENPVEMWPGDNSDALSWAALFQIAQCFSSHDHRLLTPESIAVADFVTEYLQVSISDPDLFERGALAA